MAKFGITHTSKQWLRKALLLFVMTLGALARADVIHFPGGVSPEDKRWDYVTALLQLVLDKTHAGEEKTRVARLPAMSEARRIAELHAGRLDVAFGLASIKLEKSGVISIPIPLHKGLTGWRLLLVTPQSATRFSNVRDLPALQNLRAGFSTTFADYPIMVANGLTMSPGTEYLGLFEMLRLDRSDYISRGIGEIYQEVSAMDGGKPGSLLVQPTLALHYPTDMVFIVNPKRTALAARLEKGLRQAIVDGSRERLFQQHFSGVLEKAAIHKRIVIEMHNPDLPDTLDRHDKSLWWRPHNP